VPPEFNSIDETLLFKPPEEPDTLPVTLPIKSPIKVVAYNAPVEGFAYNLFDTCT
jgi:hypothetical protein